MSLKTVFEFTYYSKFEGVPYKPFYKKSFRIKENEIKKFDDELTQLILKYKLEVEH